MKSQSFLKGAAILTFSTVIVKLIGFIYTIPLINLLGGEGMGYYYTAYDIYALLSVIFTAGLPIAEIKLISEAHATSNQQLVNTIFRLSRSLFCGFGILCATIMLFGAETFSYLINSPGAKLAIQSLSPMILSSAILSAYRGYFQGKSNMIPTAITQILEATIKIVIGTTLAFLLLNCGFSPKYLAAGAIAGVSIGSIVALACAVAFKHCESSQMSAPSPLSIGVEGLKPIFSQIVSLVIPITIGTALFNLINLVDTGIILNRLQLAIGYSSKDANTLLGIYGNTKKIYNLPIGLIIPLSSSIIPAVVNANARMNQAKACDLVIQAIKLTAAFSFPCGIGLISIPSSILGLIYYNRDNEIIYATPLLAILGIAVIFSSLASISSSIIQVTKDVYFPSFSIIIGAILNIVACWVLVGKSNLGILGAAISTCICYFVVMILNFGYLLKNHICDSKIFSIFVKVIFASLIMGAVVFHINCVLTSVIAERFACIISVIIACVIYGILVVILKIITWEDLCQFRIGKKLYQYFYK